MVKENEDSQEMLMQVTVQNSPKVNDDTED